MKIFLLGSILIIALFGCSSPNEDKTASGEQHKQLSNAVKQPLEQAKDVERQVFESAEQQKKQAEGL